MDNFAGKVIAITGAASGMGLATAHLLTSKGAAVSLADVQEAALANAKAAIEAETPGAKVLTSLVDVRNNDQVVAWIDNTVKEFGKLDGAANIAGVFSAQPDWSVQVETNKNWDFILDVNLTGLMQCLRAQIPHLKSGASIVNAASILGLSGSPGRAAYAASKHGVIGLTRSMAKEVGKDGIRVNCFCPGYIKTPMLAAAQEESKGEQSKAGGAETVALQRMGEPEEVAKLVAYLLSDWASFITGASISIDGGWNC